MLTIMSRNFYIEDFQAQELSKIAHTLFNYGVCWKAEFKHKE